MRNLLAAITVALVMVTTFFGNVSSVLAGNEKTHAIVFGQELDGIFTFKELGYSERIMIGPYDSERILFSTPPTWQLTSGGTITLKFNMSYSGASQGSVVGGTLLVSFNNVILDTVILDQVGPVTLVLDIPAEALKPTGENGRHLINLFFDASVNCNQQKDVNSNLVVSADSEINFKYVNVSPSVDLIKFPEPLYQPDALVSSATTIVVPDQPTALTLQSALTVSAGLGSLTDGKLVTNLVSVGDLKDDIKVKNNLIFVGLPSSFPILQSVILPIPITKNGLSISGSAKDDGIIQMALSPWNQSEVVLFVSGNTEAGVLKAGSAIGVGHIVSGTRPDVSIVSNIMPDTTSNSIAETRTLGELGYGIQTLGNVGGQYLTYNFLASPEQASSTGAYLDLVTSHSDLLKLDQTGVSIFLNGQVIASLQFAGDLKQISTTRIEILPNILRRGKNLLEVVGALTPSNNCTSQSLDANWVTISELSSIHLPVTANTSIIGKSLDLKNFPRIFLSSENLGDVAFILSKDDVSSWDEASQIAYLLGSSGKITLSDLRVAYGDEISEDILNNRSLILVGRASMLPIIGKLNDQLPAPFLDGKDEALQPTMLVNYRIMPGVSVGYIQVLPSPWNSEHAILAIMGNTNQGILMAGQSLLKTTLASKLTGNFAIAYGDQLITTDTRLGPTKSGLAGQLPSDIVTTPVVNPTPFSSGDIIPQQNVKSRANWILPGVIVISLLIIGIVFIVLRRGTKLKISEKPDQDQN
jgi:hypothetical protein